MAKIAFHTLGCKVNQYETESMMAQFEKAGDSIVGFTEEADVYIVNTCTVTNMADKKSRQMLSKAKKSNPKSLVVAVGCYVQAAKEALDKIDNVDLLIGNNDKGHVVEIVKAYQGEHIIPEVVDLSKYRVYDELWISVKHGNTRAHIKIQDGCDQFCSFCIIPFARGRIRSRDSKSILKEINELVINGYKEVVLTGIHIASYGVQFEQYMLIDLLEELNQIKGLKRIRLGSIEPTLITKEFVERLSKLNRICPHFHLSLQSGSDAVLKEMNRRYTTTMFSEAVELLRKHFKTCSITTDLIVGFPTETKENFESTIRFLNKIRFGDVHIFKYSKRDGTKAAKMSKQVDGNEKNNRSHKAAAIVEEIKKSILEGYEGEEVVVLLEDEVLIDGQKYHVGHTMNYIKVYIEANERLKKNEFAKYICAKPFKDGIIAK